MIAYFLFYNEAHGVQAPLAFSNEFKHCNILTYDGEHWIVLEFDLTGIKTRVIEVVSGAALIRALKHIKTLMAMVVVEVGEREKVKWAPFWIRSCNELDRYISGVGIGLTFNPRHLYSKLLRYNGKRNYQILSHWRRKDGRRPERNQSADG